MEKSCETCRYDLGGGRDNCDLNVAFECAAGGGYECWKPKETIVAVYEECDDEEPQEEDFGGVCSVCGFRFIE